MNLAKGIEREHEPILLVGADGMLGRAWSSILEGSLAHCYLATVERFDLTIPQGWSALSIEPKTIINCAAWTDVDGAEEHEAKAAAVNAEGVRHLAKVCAETGALLVHYSTDYVFAGDATSPYVTDGPLAPAGAYARTKAAGEEAIIASGCQHLIIRTSWLYAPWGKNFVRTIAGAAAKRPELKVVNDQRGRPTSAEHLAQASMELINKNARGIYHVTDGGECTWFDFAAEIAAFANPACRVNPCTTAEFPRPAKRPAYSVLDLSKTESLIGPMPHWKTNLANVLPRLEA
jgi:dTDP-4-dehydrorhamnose reductase